jgi:DNA-binding transcriptional ArsR family regulator
VTDDPAGRVFAALAEPTRRELIRLLAAEGPMTATQLAPPLGISRQAVAKHLGALQLAGLVHAERVGRESRYTLATAPFAHAEGWMRAIGASWDVRLQRLRSLLEGDVGDVGDAG